MRAAAFAALLVTPLMAFASEPGQPLDCSDLTVSLPGLSLQELLPFMETDVTSACDQQPFDLRCNWVGSDGRDAEGAGYYVRPSVQLGACFQNKLIREIWRYNRSNSWTLLGRIEERCGPAPNDPHDGISGLDISLDKTNGEMLIRIGSACREVDCDATRYTPGKSVCKLTGLPALFEILQTYTPTPNTLSFRVPAIPEGLPAADYFDTYYGDLATVGDWSQAQPLQCGYPASPPSVGDYLEVADRLPNPVPGHGRYYVTAVHYQGQTRYGRKSMGGVLSGRDPAVLPACAGD